MREGRAWDPRSAAPTAARPRIPSPHRRHPTAPRRPESHGGTRRAPPAPTPPPPPLIPPRTAPNTSRPQIPPGPARPPPHHPSPLCAAAPLRTKAAALRPRPGVPPAPVPPPLPSPRPPRYRPADKAPLFPALSRYPAPTLGPVATRPPDGGGERGGDPGAYRDSPSPSRYAHLSRSGPAYRDTGEINGARRERERHFPPNPISSHNSAPGIP